MIKNKDNIYSSIQGKGIFRKNKAGKLVSGIVLLGTVSMAGGVVSANETVPNIENQEVVVSSTQLSFNEINNDLLDSDENKKIESSSLEELRNDVSKALNIETSIKEEISNEETSVDSETINTEEKETNKEDELDVLTRDVSETAKEVVESLVVPKAEASTTGETAEELFEVKQNTILTDSQQDKVNYVKEVFNALPLGVRQLTEAVYIENRGANRVLGSTTSSRKVTLNSYYFDNQTKQAIAGVMLHELGHVLDFASVTNNSDYLENSTDNNIYSLSRDNKVQELLNENYPNVVNYEAYASVLGTHLARHAQKTLNRNDRIDVYATTVFNDLAGFDFANAELEAAPKGEVNVKSINIVEENGQKFVEITLPDNVLYNQNGNNTISFHTTGGFFSNKTLLVGNVVDESSNKVVGTTTFNNGGVINITKEDVLTQEELSFLSEIKNRIKTSLDSTPNKSHGSYNLTQEEWQKLIALDYKVTYAGSADYVIKLTDSINDNLTNRKLKIKITNPTIDETLYDVGNSAVDVPTLKLNDSGFKTEVEEALNAYNLGKPKQEFIHTSTGTVISNNDNSSFKVVEGAIAGVANLVDNVYAPSNNETTVGDYSRANVVWFTTGLDGAFKDPVKPGAFISQGHEGPSIIVTVKNETRFDKGSIGFQVNLNDLEDTGLKISDNIEELIKKNANNVIVNFPTQKLTHSTWNENLVAEEKTQPENTPLQMSMSYDKSTGVITFKNAESFTLKPNEQRAFVYTAIFNGPIEIFSLKDNWEDYIDLDYYTQTNNGRYRANYKITPVVDNSKITGDTLNPKQPVTVDYLGLTPVRNNTADGQNEGFSVTVKYEDEKGNQIAEPETPFSKLIWSNPYKVQSKQIPDYTLVGLKEGSAPESSNRIGFSSKTVTYVYRMNTRESIEEIPFPTEYYIDSSLKEGEQRVTTEGEKGSKKLVHKANGELVSETVTKQPVTKRIAVGVSLTKPINRVINYVNQQKEVIHEATTQTVVVERTASINSQTGEVTYTPYKAKTNFQEIGNPDIIDYVKTSDKVDSHSLTDNEINSGKDLIVNVPYYKLLNVQASKEISREIKYIYEDDQTEAFPPVIQKTTLHRIGKKNELTNEITWDSYSTDSFEEVISPTKDGYEVDIPVVNKITVNSDSNSSVVIVSYKQSNQKAVVTYIDETENKTLDTVELNGKSFGSMKYSTEDKIKELHKQGYELVKDEYSSSNKTFDGDVTVDQHYVVTLSQRTIPISPDNNENDPVDPNDPDSPVYPTKINESDVKKNVTRTIHYVDNKGNTLFDSVIQNVVYTREAKVNLVTGEVIYGEWKTEKNTHDKVISPTKDGYEVDTLVVDENTVTPNTENSIVIVTYKKQNQKAIVKYIDETENKTIDTIELNGESFDPINYTTEDKIKELHKQGYELIKDEYSSSDKMFDGDVTVDQHYVVTLSQRIVPISPDNNENDPVDPNDPDSPVYPTKINESDVKKVLTRTIYYVDKKGNTLSNPVTQTVIFTREAKVNLVTGEVIYGEWVTEKNIFDKVVSPIIEGYVTKTLEVDELELSFDSETNDVTVVYEKIETPIEPEQPNDPETPKPVENKPIEPTKEETPKTESKELPKTGETNTASISLLGLGLLGAMGATTLRKRKED